MLLYFFANSKDDSPLSTAASPGVIVNMGFCVPSCMIAEASSLAIAEKLSVFIDISLAFDS